MAFSFFRDPQHPVLPSADLYILYPSQLLMHDDRATVPEGEGKEGVYPVPVPVPILGLLAFVQPSGHGALPFPLDVTAHSAKTTMRSRRKQSVTPRAAAPAGRGRERERERAKVSAFLESCEAFVC